MGLNHHLALQGRNGMTLAGTEQIDFSRGIDLASIHIDLFDVIHKDVFLLYLFL